MKRGFLIITIFSILLGLCVFEEIYLKNNLKILYDKAENLLEIVESADDVNTELISSTIEDLDEFWKNAENYFCLVVNHINMEEAGEQISKIVSLSKLNNKDELIVEINLLIYYAESYQHIIVPNIQNIL